MTKTFRELGVAEQLCSALASQGIETAFPIQQMTLPLALQGHDLIGQARTGTGKTFAFGLPLLQRLKPTVSATQALIIVPTRELCLQVYNDLSIGAELGLRSIAVYGGVGYDDQTDALGGGAHVVVGTPGRLLDLLQRGVLDLSQVTQLVLDEADEMLDMGFLPDVERLIEACATDGRQTMLFSATMPTAIVKLGRRYMKQPTFIRASSEEVGTAPTVEQFFFQVHRMDKPRVLARILQDTSRQAVYVFVRTKHMADRLVTELEGLNTPAIAIHGDLRQTTRERNLDRFRAGKASVLVATEVAARGLDVDNVTHVVNYDCPDDDKMYLHRIGRTARAGRHGVAVTFAEHHETERLNVIRKAVGASREVTAVFSTSPELAEWFDLPDSTPWQHLGRSDQSGGTRARKATNKATQSSGRRSKPARDTDAAPTDQPAATEDAPTQNQPVAAPDTPTKQSTPTTAGRTRTRTRTRATAAASDSSERSANGQASTSDRDASKRGNRTRARAQVPTAERSASDKSPTNDTARTNDTSRTKNESRRKDHDRRSTATGEGPSSSAKRATSGSGSPSRRSSGSSRSAGNDRRASKPRGESHRDARTPQRTAPPAAGDARGDGQPQLERTVRIEHLP